MKNPDSAKKPAKETEEAVKQSGSLYEILGLEPVKKIAPEGFICSVNRMSYEAYYRIRYVLEL